MSLRSRVAATTAAAVAVVLLAAGVVLVARFADAQWKALDDSLAERSDLLADVIESADDIAPDRLTAAVRGIDDEALGEGLVARVRLPDGATHELGDFPAEGELVPGVTEVTAADGTTWRIATETVPGPGRFASASISVAEPTAPTEASIDRVRTLAIQTGVAAVAVAAALGWLLAKASLVPLARLRDDAAGLAADPGSGARVRTVSSPSEVAYLGRTLNELLDAIDASDDQRRAALESARSFAADAAHELRNPLTAMRADLGLLAGDHQLDEEEEGEIIAELVGLQDRVERTLEALRMVALSDLRGVPERAEVDLAALARSAAALVAQSSEPPARVAVAVDGASAVVRGWHDGLELAVRNVVDNAVRHGAGPDGIAVVEVLVRGDEAAVEVEVTDHGRGFPASDRERLVRRFERGHDPAITGSGLGLAIADQQMQLHGGRLILGGGETGAVVTLVVPRVPPTPR